jgi:pre-mRNA-processing factor 40
MTGQSTWEEIRERIKDTPEFLALDAEDNRKLAFEKQLLRVKEKEEGGSRERDRERDRDRDRDHKHPRS